MRTRRALVCSLLTLFVAAALSASVAEGQSPQQPLGNSIRLGGPGDFADTQPSRYPVRQASADVPLGAPPSNAASPRTLSGAADAPATAVGTGRPGELALEGVQQPALVVEKRAPAEIQVGKPAVFEIFVKNVGPVAAADVEVHDVVPQGTRLVDARPQATKGPQGELVWRLGAMRPGDEATLTLELLPTTEGEIGSVATVRFSTAASTRTICTKPELNVTVDAPKSVLAGDEVPLKIRISNSGSGVAAAVVLTEVVPPNMQHEAGGELEYEVGDLQPGETRELDLSLRAVKPGAGMNLLHARGEGKLATEVKTQIEVVAPALAIDVEGPKKRFLDRQATYVVSIANPGTASAREVELATYLPRGLQFVDADNNGEYDPQTHSVRWLLEELPAKQRGSVNVTTVAVEPGQQVLRVESAAARGVTAQKEEAILVEGASSIVFQVVDSADPIEAGGETTYQIRVANQGSKEATNVQLAVALPEGMKFVAADGPVQFSGTGRQVQFQVLPSLAPKGEAVYQVTAQCLTPGDHRCHVQLKSDDMRTPVTKEEGTRVFADE